ncbi:hypothetical protein D3C73_798730 [compost metagenome]
MEVRTGEGDVAQRRRLEGAIDCVAETDSGLERRVAGDRRAQRRVERAHIDIQRVGHPATLDLAVVLAGEGQRVAPGISAAQCQVFRRWAHPGVIKTVVVQRGQVVRHDHPLDSLTRMEQQAAAGIGQLRASMAIDALAFAEEQVHALDLLRVHRLMITLQVGVERRLVGNQRRFVHLDRQPEEQRKVRFHLRVGHTAQRHRLRGIPQPGLESRLDQFTVRRAACARHRAKHRVRRGNPLLLEHQRVEHAPANVGEGTPAAGHLHGAPRRADRLRGGGGIVERQTHFGGHATAIAGDKNSGIGIAIAERRKAVEHVVGPAIPEVAHIERGVDHRRRVAPGRTTNVDPANLENTIRLLRALVETGLVGLDEIGVEHALRADHVVG